MATNSLTALITGGTSGIGRATAKRLAKLGIHVLVVGRNAKRGDETLAEIRAAGGKADFISSDLRNASSAREVAKRALELGDGHVDILINNAGVFPFGPTDKTTEEEFDRVYSLTPVREGHKPKGGHERSGEVGLCRNTSEPAEQRKAAFCGGWGGKGTDSGEHRSI